MLKKGATRISQPNWYWIFLGLCLTLVIIVGSVVLVVILPKGPKGDRGADAINNGTLSLDELYVHSFIALNQSSEIYFGDDGAIFYDDENQCLELSPKLCSQVVSGNATFQASLHLWGDLLSPDGSSHPCCSSGNNTSIPHVAYDPTRECISFEKNLCTWGVSFDEVFVETNLTLNGTLLTPDGNVHPCCQTSSVLTADGDVLYYHQGSQRLPIGTTNQVLSPVSGFPAWIDLNHSNLANVGIYSHEELDSFVEFLFERVNQGVKNDSSPLFANLVIGGDIYGQDENIHGCCTGLQFELLTTDGDILFFNQTNARLPVGEDGQLLAVLQGLPSWITLNHSSLSDSGNNTHQEIDSFISAFSIFVAETEQYVENFNATLHLLTSDTYSPTFSDVSVTNLTLQGNIYSTGNTPHPCCTGEQLELLTSPGDLLYRNDDFQNVRLPIGTLNQFLAVEDGLPSWKNVDHSFLTNGGTHTHAELDDFVTEIQSLVNQDVTDSGSPVFVNITLAGLLYAPGGTVHPCCTGGVGESSNSSGILTTNGDLLYYFFDESRLPIGSAGQFLTVSAGLPAWKTGDHTTLSNVGTNTHSQIDAHLVASSGVHGVVGDVVGTENLQTLINKELDSATNDVLVSGVDIDDMLNQDVRTSSSPSFVNLTLSEKLLTVGGVVHPCCTGSNFDLLSSEGDMLYYDSGNQRLSVGTTNQALLVVGGLPTWQTVDHTALSNVGTNTHAQIDSHVSSSSAHGVVGNVVGTSDVQTITNKNIDSSSNTLSISGTEIDDLINQNVKNTSSPAFVDVKLSGTLKDEDGNVHSCCLETGFDFLTSAGDLPYYDSGNQRLAIGTTNQALSVVGGLPTWKTVDHATLSNVGSYTHAQLDIYTTNSNIHTAAIAAHGATGAVVGTTNVQTLTGKTINSNDNTVLVAGSTNINSILNQDVRTTSTPTFVKLNVGDALQTPDLTFTNGIKKRKIVLYPAFNDDHRFYGFGVDPNVLRVQIDQVASNVVFSVGLDGTTSKEIMRVRGNGGLQFGGDNQNVFANYEEGSFVASFTGATSSAQTIKFNRTGNRVILQIPAFTSSFSLNSRITAGGATPARLRAGVEIMSPLLVVNNGMTQMDEGWVVIRVDGTIDVYYSGGANFPGPGTVGVSFTQTVSYLL